MGVMACDRNECKSILCERYSRSFGYICNECFNELVKTRMPIGKFMSSEKDNSFENKCADFYEIVNDEFPRI